MIGGDFKRFMTYLDTVLNIELNIIISYQDGFAKSPFLIFYFKIEYTSRTNGGADSASNARRPYDVLPALRIPSHINSHFTVG